jgi:amidase
LRSDSAIPAVSNSLLINFCFDDFEDISMISGPWLKTSIMAERGIAKGQAGPRHELSIAAQGDFHYVYGPCAKTVLTINPGDVIVMETEDAFGGVVTSEQDSPTAKLRFPFLNPQCGPVAVSGVEKGDCLAFDIQAVAVRPDAFGSETW